jgi:outer membrane protein assembly factor BamB
MMKKLMALMAVVLVFSGLGFVGAYNDDTTDWYCYQKDPFRRAISNDTLGVPLSVGWQTDFGQKPVGTILISKNMAIVTGEKGLVAAYAISDGSPVWRRDFGQALSTEPTIMDDVMLCCFAGGKIVGLDTSTGGSMWENTLIGDVVTSPLPYLTNFYVYTSEKKLVTISAVSGYIYNQIDAGGKFITPLTLQIFSDNNASMLSVADDSTLMAWQFYSGKSVSGPKLEGSYALPVISNSETLIATTTSGKINCLDWQGQKQYWSFDMGSEVVSAPCLFTSSIYVAAATKSGNIKAIQIGNGKVIWEIKAKSTISLPLISVGQNIIAVTDTGFVQVLNAFDGSTVAEVNAGEPIVTAPSYSTNSIFVGTKSGKIICAKSSTGTYKFTLSARTLVVAPGTEKSIDLKLDGEGSESFYINAWGFPCRCKINRVFTPETTIKPKGTVTMKLVVDPTAPSAVYDVALEVKSTTSSLSLRQALTIIIAKPEEMLKPSFEVTYPADNQMKLKIGYSNAKYARAFAGSISFNKANLKFKSISVDSILSKLVDTKAASYSSDSSIPGKLTVFYAGKDTLAESGQVFEILFDVLATADDKMEFMSKSRTMNGQPVPSDPAEVAYSVKLKSVEHIVKLTIGKLVATIDGKEITLKVAPYVNAGKTMVPLRFIGDALGSEVVWNANEKSVVYKNTLPTGAREIMLWIGKTKALVDGKEATVTPAPEIKSGNTCVGLSFVSANFGCKTEWDQTTKTVTIKFTK